VLTTPTRPACLLLSSAAFLATAAFPIDLFLKDLQILDIVRRPETITNCSDQGGAGGRDFTRRYPSVDCRQADAHLSGSFGRRSLSINHEYHISSFLIVKQKYGLALNLGRDWRTETAMENISGGGSVASSAVLVETQRLVEEREWRPCGKCDKGNSRVTAATREEISDEGFRFVRRLVPVAAMYPRNK